MELNYTSTGHYCINISGKQETKYNEESEILLLEGKLNENEKKQTFWSFTSSLDMHLL